MFTNPGTQYSGTPTQSQAAITCNGFTATTALDQWYSLQTDANGGTLQLTIASATDVVVEFFTTPGSCSGASVCSDVTGGGETMTISGLSLHGGNGAENTATYFFRVYPRNKTDVPYTFNIFASGNALPLILKSFTGRLQDKINVLRWETLTEQNIQWHVVERSTNGSQWTELGRLASQGNAQTAQQYSLEDRTPFARTYYRLRSVDFDGKDNYSNAILLDRKSEQLAITNLYPSPTTGNLVVQFNTPAEERIRIRVMDISGRVVLEQYTEAIRDLNELPLTLNSLQAGLYTVTVSSSNTVSTPARFVKM